MKKFVTCPLSDADIESLQTAAANRKVTSGVRAFLARVGFPQNVVPAIFQDEAAFAAAQRYAPGDAFVFAEPGEVLLAEEPEGSIVEIDGSGQRIVFSTFDEFLAEFTFDASDPSELCWAVQLTFSTFSEQRVRASLAEELRQTFAPDWEALGVSAAGVQSYRAPPTPSTILL